MRGLKLNIDDGKLCWTIKRKYKILVVFLFFNDRFITISLDEKIPKRFLQYESDYSLFFLTVSCLKLNYKMVKIRLLKLQPGIKFRQTVVKNNNFSSLVLSILNFFINLDDFIKMSDFLFFDGNAIPCSCNLLFRKINSDFWQSNAV